VIKGLTKAAGTLLFYRSTGSFPVEGDPMPRSQRTGFPVADEYKLMPTSPFIVTYVVKLPGSRLLDLHHFWLTPFTRPQSAVGAIRNSHRLHCGFNTQRRMYFRCYQQVRCGPVGGTASESVRTSAVLRPGLKSCFTAVLTQS